MGYRHVYTLLAINVIYISNQKIDFEPIGIYT